jgi:hypothetical protein
MSQKSTAFRSEVSRWLTVTAIALLMAAVLFLALAWGIAVRNGSVPEWRVVKGNHGPWRHVHPERLLIDDALAFPALAAIAAALACCFRVSQRAFITLLVAVAMFFSIAHTHFWLID